MGWWMALWWVAGIVALVLPVRLVAGSVGAFSPRGDKMPEQILKRRDAKGEIEREEHQRRLEDVRRCAKQHDLTDRRGPHPELNVNTNSRREKAEA